MALIEWYTNEYLKKETIIFLQKFSIPSEKDIRNWIHVYKTFGDDGLKCSRDNKKYTFDLILSAIELYFSSEISCRVLVLCVGITNSFTLTK